MYCQGCPKTSSPKSQHERLQALRRHQPAAKSLVIWGIWKANGFYFETDPNSAKGRNFWNNPSLVVHVQDGNDTVILEGNARREKRAERLNQLRMDYVRKYQYTPDWSNEVEQIVFRVEPRIIHAWRAPRMHRSVVKFIF